MSTAPINITANGTSASQKVRGELVIHISDIFGGATISLELGVGGRWAPIPNTTWTEPGVYWVYKIPSAEVRVVTTNASGTTDIILQFLSV